MMRRTCVSCAAVRVVDSIRDKITNRRKSEEENKYIRGPSQHAYAHNPLPRVLCFPEGARVVDSLQCQRCTAFPFPT